MVTLQRMKKNYEFKKVYSEGRYYAEKHLTLYSARNSSDYNKVGFSVSKKSRKSSYEKQSQKIDEGKLQITGEPAQERL